MSATGPKGVAFGHDCKLSEPLTVGGKRAVRKGELVFNVMDHGAVGDNGTVNTVAFVAAQAAGDADTIPYTQGTFIRDHVILGNSLDKNGQHGIYVQGIDVRMSNNWLGSNSASLTNTYDNVHIASTCSDSTPQPASPSRGTPSAPSLGMAYSPRLSPHDERHRMVLAHSANTFSAAAVDTAAFPVGNHIFGDHLFGHLTSAPGITSIAAGANNGTSPQPLGKSTATVHKGAMFFGSGSAPAAGAQVVVTFKRAFAVAPAVVVVVDYSATAAFFAGGMHVIATTTGFTLWTTTAPAASQANGTYAFDFVTMG